MSAGGALQTAIAAALVGNAELTGVFDGPPARAAYPYAALDATTESDWSHKSGIGREVIEVLNVNDHVQSARQGIRYQGVHLAEDLRFEFKLRRRSCIMLPGDG